MKYFKTKQLSLSPRRFLLPQPAPPPADEDTSKSRIRAGFVCIENGENQIKT
jgi:hypothetical protein